MRSATIWLVLAGILTASAHAQERPAIPLGVYWPGEETFQELGNEAERWDRIEDALDDLRSHNVNAIWLTHLSTAETARVAELAAQRGIYLVAATNGVSANANWVLKGDHPTIIANALADWGNAPAPLAWGLCDEPTTAMMPDMAKYVSAWHTHAPNENVTTVVIWGDLRAAMTAGFDQLCADVYPFDVSNFTYSTEPWNAWLSITRRNVYGHPMPWAMGQAFQTGNDFSKMAHDTQGNLVYLAGAKPVFVMPTPEQISWQAWTALAEGSRGMFFFCYRGLSFPVVNPLPLGAVNTRSPWGMTYRNGNTTPQYEALGVAFGRINALRTVLTQLRPDPNGFAQLKRTSRDSRVVRILRNAKTGTGYLLAVGGYESSAMGQLTVQLGPEVTQLRRTRDNAGFAVKAVNGLKEVTLQLTPGAGELYLLVEDSRNRPTVYRDDFYTDKLLRDCLATAGLAQYPSNLCDYVLSAVTGVAWPAAYVKYDLDARLGKLPSGGLRVMSYRGSATPATTRGVQWAGSSNNVTYSTFSQNQFEQAVPVKNRYLRGSVSWSGAANYNYGYLSDFTVWQWKTAAKSR
jgi:hypothetical protein